MNNPLKSIAALAKSSDGGHPGGWWAVCVACVLGCGEAPAALTPVTGRVTLDGRPLADAVLEFVPSSGSPSFGRTDVHGRYELWFSHRRPGGVAGLNMVRVLPALAENEAGGLDEASEVLIPAQYSQQPRLKCTVKRDPAGQTIDFQLLSPCECQLGTWSDASAGVGSP